MNSSEAAEQMVKFSIEGIEMLLRVSGTGAERIAVMLYTMAKDKQMTKGKTSLNKMLKSGSPLQIFSVKTSELKKFEKEAKKYGILYTALIDKNLPDNDGIVDIMVRSEDASKVNRVVERFKLAQTDNITIKENKPSVRKLLQRLKDEVKYRNVPKDYRETIKKGQEAIEIDVNKKTKTTYSPDGKVKKQKFKNGKER